MEVRNLTVIGAGLMGTGIAHVSALGGIHTTMVDISSEILEKALGKIKGNLQKGIELEKIDREMMEQALSRLKLEMDLEKGVREADMVIEAVPEKIELKLEVFRKVDQLCREEVIFASNTSALSVTEMASVTERPEKVLGMHFFNPVPVMTLLEIVRTFQTSEETLAVAQAFGESLDKTIVVAKDMPGFIVNRLFIPYALDAITMLQNGLASREDIDAAAKLGLNHPMGPLTLLDFVGLDTTLFIADAMYAPVVSRFTTYAVEVDAVSATYMEATWALPEMQDWRAAAEAEPMVESQFDL